MRPSPSSTATGVVPLGEAAVAIVTAAAHRAEAYEANRFVIEAIKERLPIWKRERFVDGSEWKRPGSIGRASGPDRPVARANPAADGHNARVMATPKPGEIRCPTCHRSTPPAAFCTQCGSAIPTDARARPRGMDRDELQDRIRARRSGGDPYRRGSDADEGTGIYERFEPDPTDSHGAVRALHRRAADRPSRRVGGGRSAGPAPAT